MAKRNADEYIAQMKVARDTKVHEHLLQYAPVWLIQETPDPDHDSLMFKVMFCHPLNGWVIRQYWYDAFTDVLHHRGQVQVDESKAVEFQSKEPYLDAPANNNVLSYGG
jgi:hypothetical protein